MNYAAQRATIRATSATLMGIGIALCAGTLVSLRHEWLAHPGGDLQGAAGAAALATVLAGLFFYGGLSVLRSGLAQLDLFKTNTYLAYKAAHPECVKGNTVACDDCGNTRIFTRPLYNRTYHRAHFCTQCGKTLYYSPEQ